MSKDNCNVCVEPAQIAPENNTCNTPFERPMIKIIGAKVGGDNTGCTFNLAGPLFPGSKDSIKIDCALGKVGGGNNKCTIFLNESVFTGNNKDTRIRNISWQVFGGNKECMLSASGAKYGTDTNCKICHVGVGLGGKNSDSTIDMKDTTLDGPNVDSVYTLFTPNTGGANALTELSVGSIETLQSSTNCKITVIGGVIGGNTSTTSHDAISTWQTDCKPPKTVWHSSVMAKQIPAV